MVEKKPHSMYVKLIFNVRLFYIIISNEVRLSNGYMQIVCLFLISIYS